MSSNGSANELLASLMPLSPGDHISEDFEEDWQMENGDEYSITAVPDSDWLVVDLGGGEFGEKGAPITFTKKVRKNALALAVGALEEIPTGEPTEDQYCSIEAKFSKPPVIGIKSVTLSTAIGDSTAQLSALQMEYVEGGTNEATVQLTGTVDRGRVYTIDATPFDSSWCTIVAEGESTTSSMAGYSVSKGWTGDFVPDEIVIKGSADQAGTQDVFTLTIKVNRQS